MIGKQHHIHDHPVKTLFRRQRGLRVKRDAFVVAPRSMVGRKRAKIHFIVHSGPEFQKQAKRASKINEFHACGAARLPDGIYSFVITRSGLLVTGKLEDSFELGVKHQNLADGREIVSAGEVLIHSNGDLIFNVLSGTYSREIQCRYGVTRGELKSRTHAALKLFFTVSNVKYTARSLGRKRAPDFETLKRACGKRGFRKINREACCKAVGVGCRKRGSL